MQIKHLLDSGCWDISHFSGGKWEFNSGRYGL